MSGTGAGQPPRQITGYVGSTKVATVASPWIVTPDNTSVFVINPFVEIGTGSAPTAAAIADAVWDEAASGHVSAGTFGLLAANLDATVSSRATQTSVNTIDDFVDTEIAAITSTLGTVNTNVSSILTAVDTEVASILAAVDTEIGALTTTLGTVNTNVSAIQTTVGTINTNVSAVQTAVDTEVASILAAVDTEVGAIKTVTDQLVAAQAESTGVPAANDTPLAKLNRIHSTLINGKTVDNTTGKYQIKNSAGTVIWEYDVSSTATTTTTSSGNAP